MPRGRARRLSRSSRRASSPALPPVIFGDGSQTRDFTWVEETARGIVAADRVRRPRRRRGQHRLRPRRERPRDLRPPPRHPRRQRSRARAGRGASRRRGGATTRTRRRRARCSVSRREIDIREGLERYVGWLAGERDPLDRAKRAGPELVDAKPPPRSAYIPSWLADLSGVRLVVLGADGFIGSHVTRLAAHAGAKVRGGLRQGAVADRRISTSTRFGARTGGRRMLRSEPTR